jgi:hypothetical protein
MVREAEVTCISKTDHLEPYDRIRTLGGGAGPYWEISHARAIELLEHDRLRFYTCTERGDRLYLVVVTSRTGHKYIKTVADADEPAHLLELPDCGHRPASCASAAVLEIPPTVTIGRESPLPMGHDRPRRVP